MNKHNLNTKKLVICLDGFRHGGTQHAILHFLPYLCENFSKVYLLVLQENKFDLPTPGLVNLEVVKYKSKKFFDVLLCIRLIIFFWSRQPDIILSSMFRSMTMTCITKNLKSKIFWMEQNTYTMRTLIQWKFLRILALKVYKVICISSDVATYTSSYIPIQNKVVIIPNPINIPQGKRLTRPSKNEFIFIGRLVKQKDPVLALKSFHHFLENYDSNSILHIVGNGDLEKQLKNLSYKLNISKRCIFHGFLSNQDVYTILRQTTALISTSSIEGFAMVRFEALVNGNCLITTNTAGTEQYLKIAFNSGVFVASPNKVDFSDKMFKSTNYRYWEKKIIQERIKLGLSFSPQSVSSLLIKEFESIKN